MLARLSAFVIWALVAAAVVFWGLRLFVRAPGAPAYTVAVGETSAAHGDLARVLGATPVNAPRAAAPSDANSRFRLLGIVAPKYARSADDAGPGHGVALIAVDGKMPKAYAVGARVDGDLVLQSVSLRTVSIATGQGAPITLELPAPAVAATGSLPGAMAIGTPSPPMPVPPFQPVTGGPLQPPAPARPEPGSPIQ